MNPKEIGSKKNSWTRDFYGPIYIPKEGDVLPLNETNYFEDHKLKRIFSSFEEQNNWIGKTADSNYEDLIAFNNLPIKKIKTPFGNGLLKKAHRLNVKDFLLFVKNKYHHNIRIIDITIFVIVLENNPVINSKIICYFHIKKLVNIQLIKLYV